jgi:hypothetical protein
VNGLEEAIASALQDLAEHAAAPRPMAAAAWRAGRRRRARTAAASAGCAVATVAAVALPFTVLGPRQPEHRGSDVTPPLTLRMPIQFRQVAAITKAPCRPSSGGLTGGTPPACFHLTGGDVSITRVTSLKFAKSGPNECGKYVIVFSLTGREARSMFSFTGKLARQRAPRNQAAIIVGGLVVAHPVVQAPVSSDGLMCFRARAQAEQVYQDLRGS